MNWTTALRLFIIIIIIIGGVIIVIIGKIPVTPDPPICPQCGLAKMLGITQILVGIVSLFAIGKIRNELPSQR